MSNTRNGAPSARDKILAAAEGVFAERGFRGATIGAISASAGVNRALIYYYFESKEDIYRCLVAKGAEAFREILDAVPPAGVPARERLLSFIRSYVRLCLDGGGISRMIRRELAGGDGEGALIAGPFNETVDRLSNIVADGVAGGELRDLDPRATAHSLLGMMNVLNDVALLTDDEVEAEAAAMHTLDLFLGGAAGEPANTH